MPYQWFIRPSHRTWLWNFYVVIVTVVTGLFLAWLSNRLLIDEVVKRAMSRIYAPLLSLNYSQAGQRAITVVTIDDMDLKEYGLNWPVPLDYYQRLLDRLVKQKPKAVFLDVLFLDDKPEREIASLVDAACRATDAGIPFYMATFARGPLSSNAEQRIFNARTSTGIPCTIPVRSNVSPDSLDQSQWAYPLRPRVEDELDGNANLPDSVALSIYCRLYAATCPTRTEVPLSLIWATKAAPTNVETMVVRGPQGGSLTPVCRGVWNWWEVLPGANLFFTLAGHPALPLCPYNQVIPVRAFKGQGFSTEELQDALGGKIVLIGADLKAIGDNSFSPLHGRLPGVLVHAMALDNLISFEGKYRENGEFEWHGLWHAPANIFIFLSVLLTTSVMVLWKHHKQRTSSDGMSTDIRSRIRFNERPSVKWLQSLSDKYSQNWLITKLVSIGFVGIKIFIRIPMVLMLPFLLILGEPRFGSTQKSRHESKQLLQAVLIYITLGSVVLYLGYYVFRQGPLSIIEYVLFPLMAHFLHIGEMIANRSRQFWRALQASNPWEEWARQALGQNTKTKNF